jgi:methyltransferase family protein
VKIDYVDHYDEEYWSFRKKYRTPDGQEHLYQNPSLDWEGWDVISSAMRKVLPRPPASLLDIGCGGAGLTERFRVAGYDAWGVDVSRHAVENAVTGMRGRIALADITTAPKELIVEPVQLGDRKKGLSALVRAPASQRLPLRALPVALPTEFDVVMATDLMEHFYEEDLDQAFDWMLAKTAEDGFLFLLIATTAPGEREFVLKKGAEVPIEHEVTAIAGHVNVRGYWNYWVPFFRRKGVKIRWDLMYMFQSLRCDVDWWNKLIQWGHRSTVILQKP